MQSYVFVPGNSDYERSAAHFVSLHKDTKIITNMSSTNLPIANLHDFIAEIAAGIQTTLPVQDLYLIAHGTPYYFMKLPLDRHGSPVSVTRKGDSYITMDQVAVDQTITIVPNVINPRPMTGDGLPKPCVVNVFACFCGRFDQYLRRFREALGGGALGVSAPINWDGYSNPEDSATLYKGVIHYMLYDLRAVIPDTPTLDIPPIKTRKDLIDAFVRQNRDRQRIDGSIVPRAVFEKFVPKDYDARGERLLPHSFKLKPPIQGIKTLEKIARYWCITDITGPHILGDSPAKTQKERRDFILPILNGRREFQPDYALPYYRWYGFSSLADFVNGFDWNPGKDPGKEGQWTGNRKLYMLAPPVVDTSNENELVYDYISDDGTVQEFNLTNYPNLFGRVFA